MSVWQTRRYRAGLARSLPSRHNPKKPGRPSHSYHNTLMANTRLAMAVEVMAGNETAPLHSMPGIWAWLDS